MLAEYSCSQRACDHPCVSTCQFCIHGGAGNNVTPCPASSLQARLPTEERLSAWVPTLATSLKAVTDLRLLTDKRGTNASILARSATLHCQGHEHYPTA